VAEIRIVHLEKTLQVNECAYVTLGDINFNAKVETFYWKLCTWLYQVPKILHTSHQRTSSIFLVAKFTQ